MPQLLVLLFSLLLLATTQATVAAESAVRVTATTSMVADLVRNVGGDRVRVDALMGPGVDPHLYKATAADINKLQRADVIFYSGLMLEGKMQDVFTQMARRKKFVFAVTEKLPQEKLLSPPSFGGHHDPHVWFDVQLWSECIDRVVEGLAEFDPKSKDIYQKNGIEFRKRLKELDKWALKKAHELSEEKRVLITSHDAFNYFGKAYDFTVVGLQGISTVTEAGLADMARMVDYIKQHNVKAVFVESSVPHNTIERISRDAGVKVGGELFSDAMGTPGKMEGDYDVGTYEGMIKHNLNTIVNALK